MTEDTSKIKRLEKENKLQKEQIETLRSALINFIHEVQRYEAFEGEDFGWITDGLLRVWPTEDKNS